MRALFTTLVMAAILPVSAVYAGDRVVARVGSEAVTSRELSEAQAQDPSLGREKALDLLIERRLVLVWAAGKNISVREAEVDDAIASIMERNSFNEDQFEKALETRGETVENFRATLLEQLTINKALGMALSGKIEVSSDELEKLYVETYPRQTAFKVSHILLTIEKGADAETEERIRQDAERILADIRSGISFDGAALKHSQDPTTSDKGGHLGTFSAGELLPELEELAEKLQPGEVGGPVKTAAGYHLLLLESRELTEPPPLSEVRNSLERSIMAQKEESVRTQWLKELKETTYIEVFPDDE